MKTWFPSMRRRIPSAFAARWAVALGAALALVIPAASVQAFALLGPYADWMQPTNCYRLPGEIGGPMDLGEEYRWNVPVVTYAFDPTFVDYFGSNGVAAVESAIQILNELAPASTLALTNYPLDSTRINYLAQSLYLLDVKSMTLSIIIEQMGLAMPSQNVFDLRQWLPIFSSPPYCYQTYWESWAIPSFIIERNFDPESLAPTHFVNGIQYFGEAVFGGWPDVIEYASDPNTPPNHAVADYLLAPGEFYKGLTRDDAGGLRYLVASNNVHFETLLPDVHGSGTNTGAYVDGVLRPGVEKITFIRQLMNSALGQYLPLTNQFLDTYLTNGQPRHQQLERVITQPDILFCVADTGEGSSWTPDFVRTGTSNWCDNAALNGDATRAGPGVIRPPVRITFNRMGASVTTSDNQPEGTFDVYPTRWASIEAWPDPSVAYPCATFQVSNDLTVHLHVRTNQWVPSESGNFTWRVPTGPNGTAVLQTTTNLMDWVSLLAVTNDGSVVDWVHVSSKPQRFFRAVAQ